MTAVTTDARALIGAFLAERGGFNMADAAIRTEWNNGSAAEQVRWPSANQPGVLVIVDSYDGRRPSVAVIGTRLRVAALRLGFRTVFGLPRSVKRLLAGPQVRVEDQGLDLDVQLLYRIGSLLSRREGGALDIFPDRTEFP